MGMDMILEALRSLRVPLQQGEYDLHALVEQALTEQHIPWAHEVKLAPRCRIDLMCGSIGIEIKRGKPSRSPLLTQLTRYAQCPQVHGMIVVAERSVDLPAMICGKPLTVLCLNRLWGIAL